MNSEIRNIYKNLGINCSGILLFGDTIRRPWTLTFNHEYINNRLINVNEYTHELLDKCMALAEPALTEAQYTQIKSLIKVVVEPTNSNTDLTAPEAKKLKTIEDDNVYTVEHLLKQNVVHNGLNEEKQYGIWSEVTGRLNVVKGVAFLSKLFFYFH